MDTSALVRLVDNSPLSSQRDLLLRVARPAIDIARSVSAPAVGSSRLGGAPDLPAQFAWPEHAHGPCGFLGQLDLNDIPAVDVQLPRKGLLSLFHCADAEGRNFWRDPGYVRAHLFSPGEVLRRRHPPHEVNVGGTFEVTFRPTVDLPFDRYQLREWPFGNGRAYHDIRDQLHQSPDYLLGYPAHCSLGYDPTPGPEWISLLNVWSHDELEWCWHDGDRLMVFIRTDDLARAEFSNLASDAG